MSNKGSLLHLRQGLWADGQTGKVYIKVFWLASIILSIVLSIILTIVLNLIF